MGESSQNDFGFFFIRARSEMGMSLHDLSRFTRIPLNQIKALEDSDHASLPECVYVKGFIKACCDVLELDSSEVISSYLDSRQIFLKAKKTSRHFWISRKTVLAVLLAGCILFGLLDLYSGSNKLHQKSGAGDRIVSALSETGTGSPEEQETAKPEIIMTVHGRDNASMKIMKDGGYPEKVDIIQGSRLDFRAKKNFNILLESPRNVEISFDGKPYSIPGNEQVVNIFYP